MRHIAKTASRKILGSMNDLSWLLEGYLENDSSPLALSLRLAETPCGPLGMERPSRATLALFGHR